jgi:hypothetical protein
MVSGRHALIEPAGVIRVGCRRAGNLGEHAVRALKALAGLAKPDDKPVMLDLDQ